MGDRRWGVLTDVLPHWADAAPDRVAFVHREDELTFAELAERATARANALRSAGVQLGDRIALVMSPGLRFVETFWAAQLLGAVPCAFNPYVPEPTLAARIERIRPTLVVTDETAGKMVPSGNGLTAPEISPDDLAFLQLTSGTSGAPRASMILQRNIMAYEQAWQKYARPDDVMVGWVPPWHDLGLVLFVIRPVYLGIRCHLVDPAVRTIPEWLATVSQARGSFSAAPDFAFRLAVRMVAPETVDLSSLRFMASGGEPVRWPSIAAFEQHFGLPGAIRPGYGLGEATLGVTSHIPGEELSVDERGNVSCGRPIGGLEVKAGSSVHEPDEILVRGETVFPGYFESPEETARVLRDGWLHTGDSGYLDREGRLFVLGRRAGMIKRAGALIPPTELEEAALRASGVRVAGATSVRDLGSEQEVIAVAVEADVSEQRSADQIAADVSREIVAALGFAPGHIRVLPRRAIPRTENGKIRHGRLRELLEDRQPLSRAKSPAVSPAVRSGGPSRR